MNEYDKIRAEYYNRKIERNIRNTIFYFKVCVVVLALAVVWHLFNL